MSENPEFVLNSKRITDKSDHSDDVDSEPIPPPVKTQKRRGTLFAPKPPPSVATQYRDLLENAMYQPSRSRRVEFMFRYKTFFCYRDVTLKEIYFLVF
jgi:hypothetical protein